MSLKQPLTFQKQMRKELLTLSKVQAKEIVDIQLPKGIDESKGGGVFLFLHFGNFFLSGVALQTFLNLKYTAIASTLNFKLMSKEEEAFWVRVHTQANRIYSRPMFLTHELDTREIISYLRAGNFLGAALDVSETAQKHKFSPFQFLNNEIMLQTGPARLARMAEVPIYGLTIAYNKRKKKHELHITQPYSSKEVEDSVQAILQKMEPIIEKNMDQLFHDLFFLFSKNNLKDVMIEAKPSLERKAKTHAPVAKVQSDLPSNFSPRYESEITSWHPHRGFAYDLIRELNPKIIVELGVHFGDSYFTFCQACEELELNTQLYGIDHWQGDEQAGFFGDEVFEEVSDYETEFYEENSTLIKTNFDDALGEFSDGSIDLLHIDGSHEYENIRNDFHNWLPKIRKGGKILIHDILVEREDFGVRKFWNEISQTYNTQSHPEGFGLGIVNC